MKRLLKADSMVGKEGSEAANAELLQAAIDNSDDKASVLYYVLRLRGLIRTPDITDEEVLAATTGWRPRSNANSSAS